MWQRKKLLIVSIVAVVVLIISAVIGVTVSAQGGSTTPTPSATTTPTPTTTTSAQDALIAKIAEKLGIDKAKVADAITQATKELRQEALKTRLDAMVKAGKITQAQEDAYLQWIQSMPNIPGLTNSPGGMGGCNGFEGKRGGMGFRGGMKSLRPGNSATTTPTVTPSATTSSY